MKSATRTRSVVLEVWNTSAGKVVLCVVKCVGEV